MKKIIWLVTLVLIGCSSLPSKGKKIQVHGHRGSRGTLPENSLVGLQEALAAGADILEFDLHLTAEEIPVLSHDAVVNPEHCLDAKGRPIKQKVSIHKTPLKKIRTFDCGSLPHPRFPEQKQVPKTSIPTLEEVLVWVSRNPDAKNVQLNIETKMDEPDSKQNPDPKLFAQTVIKLLRKYALVERSILQSFDFRTLAAAKTLEPRLRLSALFEHDADFCAETEKLGAEYLSPEFVRLKPADIEKCHSKGIQIHPWTLNTEAEWKKAIEMGVDGIITDYPRKLIGYLKG